MAGGAEGDRGADEIAAAVRMSITRVMRQLRLNRTDEIFTPHKVAILGSLYDGEPVAPTALAGRERIRPQSLTRILSALEDRGFVSREIDDADRRRQLIRITEDGKKALIADVRGREAWLSAAMQGRLSPAEREALYAASRLLDRLMEEK